MSELAVAHLRQAVRLSADGDHLKAVELLEKARILVRDNESLRVQVLQVLAGEYTKLGRSEEAARCRKQFQTASAGVNSPPPQPLQSPQKFAVAPAMQAPIPPLPSPAARPASGIHPAIVWGGVAIAALFLVGLVLAGFVYFHRTSQVASGSTTATHTAPQPAVAAPGQGKLPAQVSTTAPAALKPAIPVSSVVSTPPPVVAVVKPLPNLAKPVVPVVAPLVKVDRQELLKETVGLCVVVVRYEGPVGEKNFRVELPVGTGTAFCVNATGVMLTNRHVVDAAKEAKLPDTLDDDHLPFVTLREISYIVCFGPDPKDRYVAKVLHKSEKFDMAVLKIDRPCPRPLTFAARTIRQGDDVLVCGYPGAVMEALNQSSNTPDRITAMTKKWRSTRHVEPFDEFSPDSFYSTLTRGIISAPDRHVDGVSYIQIDAAISPGNSGGPALDPDNEVLGIATWQLRPPADSPTGANYNFALGIAQVVNELKPYLKD